MINPGAKTSVHRLARTIPKLAAEKKIIEFFFFFGLSLKTLSSIHPSTICHNGENQEEGYEQCN